MELRKDLQDWMDDHKEWSDEIQAVESVYASYNVEDKLLELQAEIETLQDNRWIGVDGYRNMPNGRWEVAILKSDSRKITHIAEMDNESLSSIGHVFATEEGEVYAHRAIGETPNPKGQQQ